MKWKVEKCGEPHPGFVLEYWTISYGDVWFRTSCESDAIWLCAVLNGREQQFPIDDASRVN